MVYNIWSIWYDHMIHLICTAGNRKKSFDGFVNNRKICSKDCWLHFQIGNCYFSPVLVWIPSSYLVCWMSLQVKIPFPVFFGHFRSLPTTSSYGLFRYRGVLGRMRFAKKPFCIIDLIVLVGSIINFIIGSHKGIFQ